MPLLGEHAQIRDMFLLGYFSCQRISDYGHLNKSNFKVDEETGLLLFAITQKKTGTYVEVPIVDNRVKAICEKYNYDFPQIDRRNVNRKNKAIMKELSLSVPSLRELVVTKLTYAEEHNGRFPNVCWRGCVKIGTSSFFYRKAPTFSSQGFVMSKIPSVQDYSSRKIFYLTI